MSSSVSEERQNQAVTATHIKRKGEIAEIVNLIVYSALEAPPYLTGPIVPVNGGQYV